MTPLRVGPPPLATSDRTCIAAQARMVEQESRRGMQVWHAAGQSCRRSQCSPGSVQPKRAPPHQPSKRKAAHQNIQAPRIPWPDPAAESSNCGWDWPGGMLDKGEQEQLRTFSTLMPRSSATSGGPGWGPVWTGALI